MELALSLEKLNFQKLRELHDVADRCGDVQMADFIEGDLLREQVGVCVPGVAAVCGGGGV